MADLTKWKLVPVEPTAEMQEAGYLAMSDGDGSCADTVDTYRAMLAASPAPSLPTREEIARAVYEATCESYSAKPYWPDEPSEIKALHRRQADRVLSLFAQPQEKKL